MKILKRLIFGAALLLGVFVLAGLLLPDFVEVERDITIEAPAGVVFDQISNFNRWEGWSPWADIDPDTVYRITGQGVGHRMVWTSDHPNVGNGAQEIIALTPPSADRPGVMETVLDFGGQGRAIALMTVTETTIATIVQTGGQAATETGAAKTLATETGATETGATESGKTQTRVVWRLQAHMREGVPLWMQPIATYMKFMMDEWIGADYERGLARLKTVCERSV